MSLQRVALHYLVFVYFAAIASTISGCGFTEFDPFRNQGRYYSVYGFLSADHAYHSIRVIKRLRIRENIVSTHDLHASIDALVTTTDTMTGEVVSWSHRLTKLEDGSYGHIFHATFIVQAAHTYRLNILRSDGMTTSAETTVPSLRNTRVERGSLVVGTGSRVFQDIHLQGVFSPWGIEVIYYFFKSSNRISYDRAGTSVDGEGWTFRIDYARDIKKLATMRGIPVDQVQWIAMGVKCLVLDKNWNLPEDIFDPEILAQPGRLSNVENGYGYFGSVRVLQDDWTNSSYSNSVFGF